MWDGRRHDQAGQPGAACPAPCSRARAHPLDANAEPVVDGKLKGLRRTDLWTPMPGAKYCRKRDSRRGRSPPGGMEIHDFLGAVNRMVHETPASVALSVRRAGEFARKCSSALDLVNLDHLNKKLQGRVVDYTQNHGWRTRRIVSLSSVVLAAISTCTYPRL